MGSKVTVIILNWNGKNWLEQFLPSVVQSSYKPLEILLVDNGSNDDSLEFVHTHYPQIKTLAFDQNYGFTEGHNKALPHIDSPYICLLNSDVEVPPGWIEPLVETMEQNPLVASVQPKIIAHHDKKSFEYAGACGGFLDKYAYPFCRGRLFDVAEKDEGQYDESLEIFWATGACSMLRKSVIDEIGLFEGDFFAHMEEIDFCWRAKNFGYKIMVEPKSHVYHVGGGALPRTSPFKAYLNVRNSLAMMYKNLPKRDLFRKIFVRLVFDGIWGAKSFFRGEFGITWAIIRAHFAFYGKLGFWRKRRKEIYADRSPVQHSVGYYPKSIVWQHFGKGKKTWSSLMKGQ